MPSLVLGKRARVFEVVKSPRTTRSKNVKVLADDSVANTIEPLLEPTSIDRDMEPKTPKRVRRAPPTPSKSAARLPLSPQKSINAVFRSAKLTTVQETVKSLEVPQTPRRRDRVQQKLATTPRHRVCVVSNLTPRTKLLMTPNGATPRSIITTARALFSRSTNGGRLIGRNVERTQLTNFIWPKIEAKKGGCIYVSGPPGCGKSALLNEVMGDIGTIGIKKATVNCMALHTPGAIYNALMEEFGPESMRGGSTELSDLAKLFISTKQDMCYVLVLDEIDHLLLGDLLSTLFELSLHKNSRLLLVGIANALDLTARFLPRLKSKGLEPDHLPFHPYTAPQIAEVITVRLRTLLSEADKVDNDPKFTPFVHPMSIVLLSKRVEAASGDLRKAFDILRRAFDLCEMEAFRKSQDTKPQLAAIASPPRPALSENPNMSSPSKVPVPVAWTAVTAPRVMPTHVTKAASMSLGSSVASRVYGFNAHQKAILCVLVNLSGTTPYAFNKLKDAYFKVCKRDDIALMPLVGAEFRNVVEGLEAVGVVDIMKAVSATPSKILKNKGEDRVVSRVGKMDLFTAISASGAGKDTFVKILGGPE